MTARSEAEQHLALALSLPIGSAGRSDHLAQAQTFAILAITEPRPQPEPVEEPTPKEIVAQAAAKRRQSKPKASDG